MTPINPSPFLAALRETMKSGIAAVALTESEVFFMVNSDLQRPDRIAYGYYKAFATAYEANNYQLPDLPNAEALEEVYLYLNAEKARQKLDMLNKVKEGGKDYRRFCWLLERLEKQKRAEAAQLRERAKEKREEEKAARAKEELAKPTIPEKETMTLSPVTHPIASRQYQNPVLETAQALNSVR